MESALALLWLGEMDTQMQSDPLKDMVNGFIGMANSTANSVTSSVNIDGLRNIGSVSSDMSMTPSERKAKSIIATGKKPPEPTSDEISLAITELANVSTFNEASQLCSTYSKQLLLIILSSEFNTIADTSLRRAELITMLSDSVALRKKIVSSYSVPHPFEEQTRQTKAVPEPWSESLLVPEKEIMMWFMSTSKKLLTLFRQASTSIDVHISDGAFAFLSRMTALGLEAARGLATWAIGDRKKAHPVLFTYTFVTILLRRSIFFFLGLMLCTRFVRKLMFYEEIEARTPPPTAGIL
jgi:hypothetical protein